MEPMRAPPYPTKTSPAHLITRRAVLPRRVQEAHNHSFQYQLLSSLKMESTIGLQCQQLLRWALSSHVFSSYYQYVHSTFASNQERRRQTNSLEKQQWRLLAGFQR